MADDDKKKDSPKKKESGAGGAVKNDVLIDPDEREIAVPDDEDKVDDMVKAQQATDLKEAKDEDEDSPKPSRPTKGKAIELLTNLASKHKKPEELHQAAEAIKDINPKRISSALKKAAGAIEHSQVVKKEARALIAKKKERETASKTREKEKAKKEKQAQKEKQKGERGTVKANSAKFKKPMQAGDQQAFQARITAQAANEPSFENNVLPNLDAIKSEVNSAKDLASAKKIFNKHLGGYDTHFGDLSDFEHKNLTYRRLGRLQYMTGQAGGDDHYNTLLRGNIAKQHKADYIATWATTGKKQSKDIDIDKDYDEHVNREVDRAGRIHKVLSDRAELDKVAASKAAEPAPGEKPKGNIAAINTQTSKKAGAPTFAEKMKSLIARLKGR